MMSALTPRSSAAFSSSTVMKLTGYSGGAAGAAPSRTMPAATTRASGRRRTVSLSGQLKKPGLVKFEEGRRVSYYLDQAGGYTWNASKGGARLIRARTGEREQLDKNLLVEAGDEIWVPEKEYRDWWAFTQSTMRTLAETLTLIVIVRTL